MSGWVNDDANASLLVFLRALLASLLTRDPISRDTRAPTTHSHRQAMAGKNLKKAASAKGDTIKEETPTTTKRRVIKEEPGNNTTANNKRKAASPAAAAAEPNKWGAAGRHCGVGLGSKTTWVERGPGLSPRVTSPLSTSSRTHAYAFIHPAFPRTHYSPASIHAIPPHGRGQRQRRRRGRRCAG